MALPNLRMKLTALRAAGYPRRYAYKGGAPMTYSGGGPTRLDPLRSTSS